MRSVKLKLPKRYPRVLSIAGSDSGGGAGIQADIKTISALGCYATTAITALTAQNTLGVQSVYAVPCSFLEMQIKAVLDDIGTDSVKVGMFASLENLELITELLAHHMVKHVVFDPVMMSSTGESLVSGQFEDMNFDSTSERAEHFREEIRGAVISLMRVTSIFTPNLVETSFLLGREVRTSLDMKEAATSFIELGANAVLIKGGHLKDAGQVPSSKVTDVFMDRSLTAFLMESKRIESANLHGTGCTLSSAIAAYLATGLELQKAVELGRMYLIQAIKAGANAEFEGSGPLNHGFAPLPLAAKSVNEWMNEVLGL